jgi:hypothetical protein
MTQGGAPEQGVAAGLQQVVQNFLVQNPQAAQLPAGQLVGAVQAPPPPPPAPPRRKLLIAQELASFMAVFATAAAVGQNVAGALLQLTQNLGNVGIVYRDREKSKANNDGVNGLQIGELLDMLNTLNAFANRPGFKADKFWNKLVTMHEIMSEDPEEKEKEEED